MRIWETKESGEDFNIEDPAGDERFGEEAAGVGGTTEEFCSALAVVNRKAKHDADDGGEDAAEIVAVSLTFNMAA